MIAPTLNTPRLTLRAHRIEDFEDYAALWGSDDARLMGGPLGRDAAWGAFSSDIAAWVLFGFGGWAVQRKDDGAHIGQVGLNKLPSFAETELGWLAYPQHRGNGYITEAARAALDFAFNTAGMKTLVSYVETENTASIRVAEALGAIPDEVAARPDPSDIVYRHAPAKETLS
ncbi:GNAT family N-acetyltransferase [Aliiroseovarius sp. 2305UL8-7]|uniref:GNAT family N-acetyltransferase n=1 Tax=Aliiroseovarius conchicola TaxID=3121637 RepID=UPI0035276872